MVRVFVSALALVGVALLGFAAGGLVGGGTEYVYITEYDEAEQMVTPYVGGWSVSTGPDAVRGGGEVQS